MAKTLKNEAPKSDGGMTVLNLPLAMVVSREGFNPREVLGDITELIDLIRTNGLVHPLTVCPGADGGAYYLIAGARRMAAVAQLGHATVAASVRADLTIDSPEALALAMAENDAEGRTALAPMEQARAYARLMAKVTGRNDTEKHKAVAKLLGRRSAGAHQNIRVTLRLLEMPERVRDMLEEGTLSKWAAVTLTEIPDDVRERVAALLNPGATESDVRRIAQDVARMARGEETVGVSAPAGDVAPPQDHDLETNDEPAGESAPARQSRPSTPPSNLLLWRTKSEVNDAIDELADEMASEGDNIADEREKALLNRLAVLVWMTGACEEISVEDQDFRAVLKRLMAAATKRMGG